MARYRHSSALLTLYRLVSALAEPRFLWRGVAGYPRFFRDLMRFRAASRAMSAVQRIELFPCLHDRTSTTGFDAHYSYLAYWATKILGESATAGLIPHVDVGSQISWVMALASVRPVEFVDIRPFDSNIPTLQVRSGSVLSLPFADQTVRSLSCLHVAEHIGLGRYGDPLDPQGTYKAMLELARVLAPSGTLLFAMPVGRERVCFNAHRVTDPVSVVWTFADAGLTLKSFACVDDDRRFHDAASPDLVRSAEYACGMYVFTRVTEG